ncbi:uncharacterized protein LOC135076604 isoform X1 [Ostrinia nubilalis]|uniref:uncharacterized protein LOC114351610 isoform X1 n=1 Tax=Ostrinia furnacalis TaxID=93504 RepID=UPI00103B20BF|nr:uncharacterized protein LOC114351610 isoform X1 [Ostrinia furnacalis]
MASAVAARLAGSIARNPLAEGLNPRISSETFTKEIIDDHQNLNSSSSYTLTSGQSEFSGDVDRWIRGTSMESTGVQNSRTRLVQRSTLAMVPSLGTSGMWYVLAMILPLFSINTNCTHWRCNPSVICYALSAVLTTAELVIAHIASICERVRAHLRRLAQDQVARDLFATAMDVVLVVYAVGFLILSMYQASIIG